MIELRFWSAFNSVGEVWWVLSFSWLLYVTNWVCLIAPTPSTRSDSCRADWHWVWHLLLMGISAHVLCLFFRKAHWLCRDPHCREALLCNRIDKVMVRRRIFFLQSPEWSYKCQLGVHSHQDSPGDSLSHCTLHKPAKPAGQHRTVTTTVHLGWYCPKWPLTNQE